MLVVLTGERKGQEFKLGAPGTPVHIGAALDCTIQIPGLESIHAELSVTESRTGVTVTDLSSGSTRLNGRLIHEAILEPGGTLNLSGVELRLRNGTDTVTILPSTKDHFGPARGRSLAMREVFGMLEAIAPTDATVLLLGETGTGKDVIAHAIHEKSSRSKSPMVTCDCGAIAPTLVGSELFGYERGAFTGAEAHKMGAFEEAEGGTLFLDEIGELPLDVQPKLLRAIDHREIQRIGSNLSTAVDVRIVAATKRDLQEEVRRGRFREDLYFRLAVVPITLPALRERREDIPTLVKHFQASFVARTGHQAEIDPKELSGIMAHDWPGNVRELRNAVERAMWLAQTGDGIAHFALPGVESMFPSVENQESEERRSRFDPERSFSEHKQEWEQSFERRYLAWLLARADGSLSGAARLASMDRKHLRTLLKKHRLELPRGQSTTPKG